MKKNHQIKTKRSSNRKLTVSIALLLLTSLSACQTVKTVKGDKDSLYNNLEGAPNNTVKAVEKAVLKDNTLWQEQATQLAFANTGWLADFNDTELNQHTKTALANNPNLKASAARLNASIASTKVINANRWPTLNLSLNPSRSEVFNNTSNQTQTIKSLRQSLDASWEADIWGRLSSERKASAFDAEFEQANYRAAELALVASVARAWYNLNTNKLSLDISRKQLSSLRDTLDIIENAYKSGLTSALDVYLNRTDIANRESLILNEEEIYDQSIRAFQQLLGDYPSDAQNSLNTSFNINATLPMLKDTVPAGLPSELIGRRPDVLASLRRYQSAKENKKIAQKAKLPSFSLTASYGGSSDGLKLLNSNELLWNFAGNLIAPIFRGGELKARAEQAKYLEDAQLQSYVATLLNAFSEVENGLSAEQKLRKRLTAFEQAVFYSESAYDLATEQYRSGLIEYTSLLEAQRRWFSAETNLIALKNTLLQNRINLYLALGGDFSNTASKPTTNVKPNPIQ